MNQAFKKAVEQFTQKDPTFTLSTCSPDGQPHSAILYFALDDELNICFFTKQETQKSKNMEENPKVALLLQNVAEQQALQMEGVVRKLTDSTEAHATFDLLMKALSGTTDWPPPAGKIDAGDVLIYKVEVKWARLGHFKGHDRDVFTQLIPEE